MAGSPDRRATDLRKLQDLERRSRGVLAFEMVVEPFGSVLSCRFRIPTARDPSYPHVRQELSAVVILLPPRYPFVRPMVEFRTPIWNPHVYVGGKLCYGDWRTMEYLDLFVLRLVKVIALDPSVVSPEGAANGPAAAWYRDRLRTDPGLFPTVRLDGLLVESQPPQIQWRDLR